MTNWPGTPRSWPASSAPVRSSRAVSDEHVVTVRDLVVEGDTLAVVTDLVAGPNLRTVLDEHGALYPTTLLGIIEQILLGVGAIHARGIVHGDLRPENVLIEQVDGGRAVRIVDFAIASLARGELRTPPSPPGAVAPSSAYVAPEVLDGHPATPASDLYAVGVLFVELVLGRVPPAPHDPAATVRDLQPPPGVAAHRWSVVRMLRAPDPARRPATTGHALGILSGAAVRPTTRERPAPRVDPVPGPASSADDTIITARGTPPAAAERGGRRPRVASQFGVAAMLLTIVVAVAIGLLPRGRSAVAVTLASAPEYWSSKGKPVVHRELVLGRRGLLVRLRIVNVPAGGFDAVELLPAMVRSRTVTTSGRTIRRRRDGTLTLHVPYRPANEARVSYRIAMPAPKRAAIFLRRYERARVRLLARTPVSLGLHTLRARSRWRPRSGCPRVSVPGCPRAVWASTARSRPRSPSSWGRGAGRPRTRASRRLSVPIRSRVAGGTHGRPTRRSGGPAPGARRCRPASPVAGTRSTSW